MNGSSVDLRDASGESPRGETGPARPQYLLPMEHAAIPQVPPAGSLLSVDDREAAVGAGDDGRQAPDGDAPLDPAALAGGPARAVEDAPGERPPTPPARVLGPDQDRVALRVGRDRRVLAIAAAGRADGPRRLQGAGVDAREGALPL